MAVEVLLIEDVTDLGRAGEVHRVASGFARNFLYPKGFAVGADRNTLRKQERLQAERAKIAAEDRAQAEALAAKLDGLVLTSIVKVDHTGQMYGSVTLSDLMQLFAQKGFELEKRTLHLPHAIKTTGEHALTLSLKEGVTALCTLRVLTQEQLANVDLAQA